MEQDPIKPFIIILIFIVGITFFFLPSIIARKKKNALSIFLLNFLLGATGVGWIIALIWACKKESEPTIIYIEKGESVATKSVLEQDIETVEPIENANVEQEKKKTFDIFFVFILIILAVTLSFIIYSSNPKTNGSTAVTDPVYTHSDTAVKEHPILLDKTLAALKPNIGVILSTANVNDLFSIYGKENIAKEKDYDNEGNFLGYSYILFKNSKDEVTVSYSQEIPTIKIDKKSGIKTPEGIYIGMNIKQLLKINGAPTNFYGFEWDYAGLVSSFNEGRLENKGISITFSADQTASNYNEFLGDGTFSSSDIGVEKLQLTISEISITRKN
jgi:hypothetical protein